MKLFTASEIALIVDEDISDVRAHLVKQTREGVLRSYVLVPMGKTLDDGNNTIVFEVA